MKKRHIQKLVLISIGLFLLFNLPFLLVFNIKGAVLGIPIFYLGIFFFWALAIFMSYQILKRHYE